MSDGTGTELEEEHEEHVNHEAWVVPYADMLTLLMALFLMLFAISTIDLQKFEALAENVGSQLGAGGNPALDGGSGPLDGGSGVRAADEPDGTGEPVDVPDPAVVARQEEAEDALAREERVERERTAETRQLDAVEQQIRGRAEAAGLGGAVTFRREVRGLVVTIVADDVLFDSGSADLRAGGSTVLHEVAAAVAGLPNDVAVEGHTDDRPINTFRYPSNWELSTARASAVLRHLVDVLGMDPARVTAAGYGAQRPIQPNGTPEGRAANRRVEIAVLSAVAPAPA